MEKQELIFKKQVLENIRNICQYYLDVESIAFMSNGYENPETRITKKLRDFYIRKYYEMKDTLILTKIYLAHWKSLPEEDKKILLKILNEYSWLLYEFFPKYLPDNLQEQRWLNNQKTFQDKKRDVMDQSHVLLSKF